MFYQTIEQRSDKRDLLAIKFKSEIFTVKERPRCCEQLQKIIVLKYLFCSITVSVILVEKIESINSTPSGEPT